MASARGDDGDGTGWTLVGLAAIAVIIGTVFAALYGIASSDSWQRRQVNALLDAGVR